MPDPRREPQYAQMSMEANTILRAAVVGDRRWEQAAIGYAHRWTIRGLQLMGSIYVTLAVKVAEGHGTDPSLVIREGAANVRGSYDADFDLDALSAACERIAVQLYRPERRGEGLRDALSAAGDLGDGATMVMAGMAKMLANRLAELTKNTPVEVAEWLWQNERESLAAQGYDMTPFPK